MGEWYQDRDKEVIDYQIYKFADLELRGPKSFHNNYIAYIGAAQTFGTYCPNPFAHIIGNKLDIGTLNFGSGGAGPRYFLNQPKILDSVNQGELVVVQIMSARSISNSVFESLRGGSMGTRILDGKPMKSDEVFKQLLNGQDTRGLDNNFLKNLIQETRDNYVNSMIDLLKVIKPPKILLWFSTRTPEQCEEVGWFNLAMRRAGNKNILLSNFFDKSNIFRRYLISNNSIGVFPQLVNRSMVEQIKQYSDFYVECATNVGMPQIFVDSQGKFVCKNSYYPSPEMHQRAAELLEPICESILKAKS
jgi:hypothetical protein